MRINMFMLSHINVKKDNKSKVIKTFRINVQRCRQMQRQRHVRQRVIPGAGRRPNSSSRSNSGNNNNHDSAPGNRMGVTPTYRTMGGYPVCITSTSMALASPDKSHSSTWVYVTKVKVQGQTLAHTRVVPNTGLA
ncbi:hypothetical protein K501DRAFT_269063 [Backusella circina FSU 941]|nr:hypothetical protein K501DRAFT_269063 [Backusella circina FSU 941]